MIGCYGSMQMSNLFVFNKLIFLNEQAFNFSPLLGAVLKVISLQLEVVFYFSPYA